MGAGQGGRQAQAIGALQLGLRQDQLVDAAIYPRGRGERQPDQEESDQHDDRGEHADAGAERRAAHRDFMRPCVARGNIATVDAEKKG